MPTRGAGSKLLFGLLVGVSLGLVAGVLLAPRAGHRRKSVLERARDSADRVTSRERGPNAWRDRKTERARRTLMSQIDRIRSAGL